jgi:C-terminal processing protease CtpA/Prc
MKTKFLWLFCGFVMIAFLSCEKEDEDISIYDPDGTVNEERMNQKVNRFIADYTKDYYLWTSSVDWKKVDPDAGGKSGEFFKGLIHADDKWSMLTEDVKSLESQFDGVTTTFGFVPVFGEFSDLDALFAIVLFVYPDTPADLAGLKRGDFIIAMNDGLITEENYRELYYASSITVEKAVYEGNDLVPGVTVQMTAVNMYENPVIRDTVLVKGENRVAYLCYSDYTKESEKVLQEIFSRYRAEGVTDVVLDLRYNGGGYAQTSVVLSSILAPSDVVKRKEVFTTLVWNDALMAYFKKNRQDVNEYFTDTLSVNMDLKRVFILMSDQTASASESTIIGLDPYMNVIRVGEATHGKYCGGMLFSEENDPEIENWGMYLMVYRFANRNGITSFTGGLEPDIPVTEDYFPLMPLGDERDPLLGAALEVITGEPSLKAKVHRSGLPGKIVKSERRGALVGKRILERRIYEPETSGHP